mmetsp:Transcript_24537/g.52863  ORF Transcript_24537/g.52863 Transcript_24537/m.52863 type:complete len:396 (+) Transcript_24537:471-1658(+)
MGSNLNLDEYNIKHPFVIVFKWVGTVWPLVLPYCLFNILLLTALTVIQNYTSVSISILPQGHALLSILIAYLGVSKVNLAYERYMSAQISTGHAFMILRELNQLSITLTEHYTDGEADEWRKDTKLTIIQLINETVATLRDERHAAALARDVGYRSGIGIDVSSNTSRVGGRGGATRVSTAGSDDPMVLVHALRSHLYHGSNDVRVMELQLFERCKLIDLLHDFTISYRNLLRLASSPLPFVLVQMGRTFVFIWTLSLPFVLTGENFVEEYPSAFFFVILLTYGFLGLEFVSRMLANPFGDEIKNDFNIRGMGSAAIIGIEEDSEQIITSMNDRNNHFGKLIQKRQESIRMSTRYIVLDGSKDWSKDAMHGSGMDNAPYYNMEEGSELQTPSVFL